jgi:hypothetical protein
MDLRTDYLDIAQTPRDVKVMNSDVRLIQTMTEFRIIWTMSGTLTSEDDRFGCPADTDRDGVPDYLVNCPGTQLGEPVDQCDVRKRGAEQQVK